MHIAEIQSTAVMAAHHKETHHLWVIQFQYFANGEEVVQAFGHLHVIYIDKAVVHPNAGHGLAIGALALGNFIFMMGELQICTTPMDIETLAQQLASHGRTLNVPTRASRTKRAVPFHFLGFVRLGRFPQHEVQRVFLAIKHRHTLACMQLVQ